MEEKFYNLFHNISSADIIIMLVSIITIFSLMFLLVAVYKKCIKLGKKDLNIFLQKCLTFKKYFQYFGCAYIAIVSSFITVYYFFPDIFIYYFLLLIVVFLLMFPLKFIYTLVGARNSLRTFVLLFIATQVLFSALYYYEIKDNYLFTEEEEIYVSEIDYPFTEEEESPILAIGYGYILTNTFQMALVQDCTPFFQKFIDNPGDDNHNRLQILLNIQFFISWIYLGVFIASIYQNIRKE